VIREDPIFATDPAPVRRSPFPIQLPVRRSAVESRVSRIPLEDKHPRRPHTPVDFVYWLAIASAQAAVIEISSESVALAPSLAALSGSWAFSHLDVKAYISNNKWLTV